MEDVLKVMLKIYNVKEFDWMNFRVTHDSPLTYHHIEKEEHGGKRTIENGAPLTKLAHQYIHQIEQDDKKTFIKLSKCLKRINESRTEPSQKMLKEIDDLLKEYEDKNKVLLQRRVKVERINPNALRIIKGAKDIYSPTNIRMVMQEGIDPMKWPKKDKKFKGYRKKYQKR